MAMQENGAHDLQAEILVLPHHGSENSYSEAFYSLVNPSYVLASCAKYNRFHFPAPVIRKYFETKNTAFLTTAEQGDIFLLYEKGEIFCTRKHFYKRAILYYKKGLCAGNYYKGFWLF